MIFKIIVISTCIIGSVHMQSTQYSPKQPELTAAYKDCIADAKKITPQDASRILIGQGPFPRLIARIGRIDTMVQMNTGTRREKGFDFRQTCELMNILIGKAKIIDLMSVVGPPMAQLIRRLQSSIDLNITEKKIPEQKKEHPRITECLDKAIRAYTTMF